MRVEDVGSSTLLFGFDLFYLSRGAAKPME